MSGGIFAEYQPRYAALGIATFPVREKRPAVAQYLKMGLPASRNLAERFAECEGLGFACGTRNNIVVVDVDSPSEKLLADALDEFGPTPFVVRSASGNHQAWYRHNGERRTIRPDKSKPIDILGGGYVVAPPSRTSKGAYTIISGSLEDLPRLPVMRALGPLRPAANVDEPAAEVVRQGSRNKTLWELCMRQARSCGGLSPLLAFAMDRNAAFDPPLSDDEVVKIAANAWEKECKGENFFGNRKGLVIANDQVERILQANGDAYILFTVLKLNHNGRSSFVCANAMADAMPGGGWSLRRFQAARKALEELGEIVVIRERSPGCPTLYAFRGR